MHSRNIKKHDNLPRPEKMLQANSYCKTPPIVEQNPATSCFRLLWIWLNSTVAIKKLKLLPPLGF